MEEPKKQAFTFELDEENGLVVVNLNKGILGGLANRLKKTPKNIKGSSILRKLGFVLGECGDTLYAGKEEVVQQ